MDATQARVGPRRAMLALSGVGVAFAWIVLSVFLGIGETKAHAGDGDDRRGLLSGVSGGVTGVVADTPVVAPVADAVSETVTSIVEPVRETVSGDIVTSIVEPVVDAVKTVPVVGDVIEATGLDTVLTDVAATADDVTTKIGGGAVDLLPLPVPAAPEDPRVPPGTPPALSPDAGEPATAAETVHAPVIEADDPASADDAAPVDDAGPHITATSASILSLAVPVAGVTGAITGSGGPGDPLAPDPRFAYPSLWACTAPIFPSAGSGGAGAGAGALLFLGPLVAHRAWVRRRVLDDEDAPPAPAASPDVSPD